MTPSAAFSFSCVRAGFARAAFVRAAFVRAGFIRAALVLFACGALAPLAAQTTSVDSTSAAFRSDSAKNAAVRAAEAGGASAQAQAEARSQAAQAQSADSLLVKLRKRRPYVGLSVSLAFGDHSAKQLFNDYVAARAAAVDSQRVLRAQDPVHLFFPMGLTVGVPVFTHLDVWLRTRHVLSNPLQPLYVFPGEWDRLGYSASGLIQRGNESPDRFSYRTQAHLAGVGLRYMVPGDLLSVAGKAGLYGAYTHYWSFGPTGIVTSQGTLAAKRDPGGAGYEVEVGFQQDFSRRFAFTGGLTYSRLAFESRAPWTNLWSNAPAEPAAWALRSMQITLLGVYQIGN